MGQADGEGHMRTDECILKVGGAGRKDIGIDLRWFVLICFCSYL